MLNYVWFALIVTSVLVGAWNGRLEAVTEAAFNMAKVAVMDIALPLVGVMALWLGIMKIAEESGLTALLARVLRPISRWLFPQVPSDHPAITSIIMNLSANWLGLANAATPLGLKAMQELQELNPDKETASNAMVTFLGLNTAAITLIPATMLAVRVSLESSNPQEIILPTILAGMVATTVAVIVAKILQRLPAFRNSEPAEEAHDAPGGA